MQQDAPIESGIGAFAKSFGNTVAKGSRNEQQQAFKAWLETKKEGAGLTKQSSEDKAKMDRLKTGEQFKINHTIGRAKQFHSSIKRWIFQYVNSLIISEQLKLTVVCQQ